MGRVELQRDVESVKDLQKLVNQAKEERADAICVPPVFVRTAADMLGRNKITIVTTAGRDEDILETKLMGIEVAAKAGASEVIACVSPANIADGKWDLIEKELFQLGQLASIHDLMLWVGCRFHYLPRIDQVRICEALPAGWTGLRVVGASVDDIKMASLCGVDGFCACFAYGILRGNSPPEPETLQTFRDAGATQFTLREVPEQLKTDNVYRTEVSL
jgi:hypothetical protein